VSNILSNKFIFNKNLSLKLHELIVTKENDDLFDVVRKVAPFATIASLCIATSAFCLDKCKTAVVPLSQSAYVFLVCVILGGLSFIFKEGFWHDMIYVVLVILFIIGLYSLGVSAYHINEELKTLTNTTLSNQT